MASYGFSACSLLLFSVATFWLAAVSVQAGPNILRRDFYGPASAEFRGGYADEQDTTEARDLDDVAGRNRPYAGRSNQLARAFDSSSGASFLDETNALSSVSKPIALLSSDESMLESFAKRNIDEIDRTAFDNFFKRNLDEVDRVGWREFVKRLADYLRTSRANLVERHR